jgi:hypothetical protein
MTRKKKRKLLREAAHAGGAKNVAAVVADDGPDFCNRCGLEMKEFEQPDGETMTWGCPKCDREGE